MTIFNFADYRRFLKDWLKHQPKNGHGILSQWAQALRISTAHLSQTLQGRKHLTHEMAEALSRELSLTEKELEYFLLLIDYDRAGTTSLRAHYKKKIDQAQALSRQFKNRVENATVLSTEARAIYYSSWMYSGLRNLIACDGAGIARPNIEELAKRLKLPKATVSQVLEFLLQHALVVQEKNGLQVGPQSTYLPPESPFAKKHHQNWRIKSVQCMDAASEEDLFYTSPMSLSEALAKQVRRQIVDVLQDIQKQAAPSPSETVRCLAIDWFEY